MDRVLIEHLRERLYEVRLSLEDAEASAIDDPAFVSWLRTRHDLLEDALRALTRNQVTPASASGTSEKQE